MQLDIYNKTTIETETIVYDIVREWQTVYTHKSITVSDLGMTGFHMTVLALSKQVYSSVYSVINTCPDSAYARSLPYL